MSKKSYKNIFNINLFYCKNENLFIIKYNKKLFYKKIPIYYNLFLFANKILLRIQTTIYFYNILLIKKFIYTILVKNYKKLNIIGVGFKVVKLSKFMSQILTFKLGFSHSIYLHIKPTLVISCLELSKLLITSYFFDNILILIFFLKLIKSINVYNGKGLLFYNEKIKLKNIKNA